MRTKPPVFDADVHHHFSWTDVQPYLPPGTGMPVYGGQPHPKVTGTFRDDAFPPGGGLPGSDPQFVVEHHLDPYEIDYALLTCGSTLGLGDLPDVDLAAVIARAANDYTIDKWLPVDERFLGAVVISPNDPEQAADEIRRVGANPRMVAVMCTNAPTLLGQPFMHPIFEACAEMKLPLQFHPGVRNIRAGENVALPTTMGEKRASMGLIGIQHLTSLVFEGVFVKYPDFRFVMNEWGVAWLPSFLWRVDMEYRGHREEVPWLTRPPSDYIAEHVRFTTQPIEEPPKKGDFARLMSLVEGDKLLMFSSDYPHHDFDRPDLMLHVFPEAWRHQVFFDNARAWYALDERLGLAQPTATVNA